MMMNFNEIGPEVTTEEKIVDAIAIAVFKRSDLDPKPEDLVWRAGPAQAGEGYTLLCAKYQNHFVAFEVDRYIVADGKIVDGGKVEGMNYILLGEKAHRGFLTDGGGEAQTCAGS